MWGTNPSPAFWEPPCRETACALHILILSFGLCGDLLSYNNAFVFFWPYGVFPTEGHGKFFGRVGPQTLQFSATRKESHVEDTHHRAIRTRGSVHQRWHGVHCYRAPGGAVCKAGGMGMLGIPPMPADVLQAAIRGVKAVDPRASGSISSHGSAGSSTSRCASRKRYRFWMMHRTSGRRV
jgi:hypothetical protein